MTQEATHPAGADSKAAADVQNEAVSPPEGQKAAAIAPESGDQAPTGGEKKAQIAETVSPPEQQSGGPPAGASAEQKPPAAEPPAADPRDARIAELEAQLAQANTTIVSQIEDKKAALAHAEATRRSELATVQQSLTESLAGAAAKYRAIALEHNPDVPAELVTGKTLDEVDASLAQAKTIVARVRAQLAGQTAAAVPGGAPVRTGPDVDSLSPIEKIKLSLKNRK